MRNLYQSGTRKRPANARAVSMLCLALLLAGPMTVFGNSHFNQYDPVITLELRDASIKDVLREIEKQTRYNFVINDHRLKDITKTISVSLKEQNIVAVLNTVLEGTDITYKIKKNHITLIPPSNRADMVTVADSGDRFFPIDEVTTRAMEEFFHSIPAIVVTGKVRDENDAALPGVNVLVKGTTSGTVTDADGAFSIEVPGDDGVLVFSFIGYVTKEVPVNGQTVLNVQLESDVKTLSEVVVIGYGTQKKSDLTGSVGTVKAEEIQERQLPSLNQALAGRIAGVAVNVNSGRPGGQTNVRIRGSSSINASNNPLYVVDGVILPVGTQTQNSNAIDFINPADIASMEVLKDASATAIYGARGANGVILITTKRGSNTGGKITYDLQLSVPTIGPNRVEMLNAKEFLQIEELAWRNAAVYDPSQVNMYGDFTGKTDPTLNRTDPLLFDSNGNPLYDTDWFKESTQNKLSQNHQLSFTGGNKESTYGAFVGYRDENGLLLNSYLRRYSVRLVFDSQIKSWVTIGGSLSYNNQDDNLVDTGTGGLNSVRMITEALPFLPVRYPDGSYSHNSHYPTMEGGRNPVDQLVNNKYQLLTQTTMGNVYANIKLAEGLELRSTVGTNIVARERDEFTSRPPLQGPTRNPLSPGQKGSGLLRSDRETFWSFENYLTYTKRFAEIHSFTGMLGVSWQETNIFGFQASTTTFLSDYLDTNNLGSAVTINTPASGRARFSFNSYFGRVNYSLRDKYLVTVTGRMDGSSKFGESNKYAFFPSAALAWRVSEEPFMKDNSLISNLKLRTSYGLTGNSEIPTYSALATLSAGYVAVFSNARVTGVGKGRLGNEELKWEKTAQADFGVEIGVLDNRISLEADVYYKKTTDMLLDAPLPHTSGYATITKNVGSMENKGFEIAITTENINRGDFSWNTTFNISGNRNKVLSLATPAPIFGVGNPNFTNQTGIIRVGDPVGSFWGLVRLGTWGTDEADEAIKYNYRGGKPILPGDIKYLDVNGDYLINDADRQIIGNAYPDFYGSLINTLRFKNFDITLDFQYSYGNDVLDMTKHSGEDRVSIANSYESVMNAWTPENQNTPIAAIRDTRAGYVTNVDTHWVEDGSFIRGRNFLLGYTFPAATAERIRVSKLRMYASVQNFMLLTKFSGNDPEVTTYGNVFAQGQTFFDYPKPTMYMFGLSIGL
jgi:TonB-dependent starch-binding outer membrane protein SusC